MTGLQKRALEARRAAQATRCVPARDGLVLVEGRGERGQELPLCRGAVPDRIVRLGRRVDVIGSGELWSAEHVRFLPSTLFSGRA